MSNNRHLIIKNCRECGMYLKVSIHTHLCQHQKIRDGQLQGRIVLPGDSPFPEWCPLDEVVG